MGIVLVSYGLMCVSSLKALAFGDIADRRLQEN